MPSGLNSLRAGKLARQLGALALQNAIVANLKLGFGQFANGGAVGPANAVTLTSGLFTRVRNDTFVQVVGSLNVTADTADVQIVGQLKQGGAGGTLLTTQTINAGHIANFNGVVFFYFIDQAPLSVPYTYTMIATATAGANLTLPIDGGRFALLELPPNYTP